MSFLQLALQANYVLDLARHFQSGQLSDAKIAVMDDDTLVEELTKVKGIGAYPTYLKMHASQAQGLARYVSSSRSCLGPT